MGLKIMFLLDLDVLMFLDLPCNNSFHPLYAAVQEGVTFVNITPCHHSMPIGVTSISTASRLAHPYSFAIRFGLCPFNASTKESTMSSTRHDHPTSTEHSGHLSRLFQFHWEQGHCIEFTRFTTGRFTTGAQSLEGDLNAQFFHVLYNFSCSSTYSNIYIH